MFGPTPKYRSHAADPFTGVPLFWSAHPDGYPVRGDTAPAFVERGRMNEATHTLDAATRILKLPDDLDQYVLIQDWLANGNGLLRYEERVVGAEPGTWHVLISWLSVRGHLPGAGRLAQATGNAVPTNLIPHATKNDAPAND